MDCQNGSSCDWEYDDDNMEESGMSNNGEEAGRDLTRNEKAWGTCDKLKADANYHKRYITMKDAFGFKNLSNEDKENFVKEKALSYEDRMFLSSPEAVKGLETLSNAVVCITVKLSASQAYGTGFFVRVNNEDVVITNSHSVRNPRSGNGVDFRLVKPQMVRVISFYDGNSSQVSHRVAKIDRASLPDKNKDTNVLNALLHRQLHDDKTKTNEKEGDVSRCNKALELLSPYFKQRDSFLDYVLLYLEPLQDGEENDRFSKMKPLSMKVFDKLENFRNVSSFGIPDPRSSRYPRALRLFTISHPHRASMKLSFGDMLSSIQHVYFLQMAYGQNDTGMLSGKEPFAEHSVPTCRGSSGAPIFAYIFDYETGEVIVEECVYFLHFYGDVAHGTFRGKSVSFSTILGNLELQRLHGELGSALAEVGSHGKGERL